MSYVVFCKGKTADKPYVIEDLKIRLFSMEELCYYIYSNVSLCDLELTKPELAGWIEKECKLPDLAESIRVILKKNPEAARIASQIFAYTDYLTKQEREAVCERIRKYSQLEINERRKMRGDYFYLDGKYQEAIMDYEEMLRQQVYEDEKMRHRRLYNIGCCYASMFYYDMAYGWFLQAAATELDREEDLRAALFCKRMLLKEDQWGEYLANHEEMAAFAAPMELQLARIKEEWEKSPQAQKLRLLQNPPEGRNREYYQGMEACLEEWKNKI